MSSEQEGTKVILHILIIEVTVTSIAYQGEFCHQ